MKWIAKIRALNANAKPIAPSEAMGAAHHLQPTMLLTVREAAALAKVSDPTIRRWIRTGQLKAHNSDRRVRINRTDLMNFLCPENQP